MDKSHGTSVNDEYFDNQDYDDTDENNNLKLWGNILNEGLN